MITRFAKTRDVKSPERGHAPDAGVDFFIPKYSDELRDFIKKSCNGADFSISPDHNTIGIPPHSSILVPSGVKIEIAHGYMGLFTNKSGIASKKKLLIGAQVIDTGYSGEVHINLHNVSKYIQFIDFGAKAAQLIFIPIGTFQLMEVSEDMLYDYDKSDNGRGEGRFGSTGV